MSDSFDRHVGRYSAEVEKAIEFGGKDHRFYTQAKADALLKIAGEHFPDLRKLSILDVGCGVGLTDALLVGRVSSVRGVDISAESIVEARKQNPRGLYDTYDGRTLPYPDDSFDLAFAICVLHHVPPNDWSRFSLELRRVTQPGGLVIIAEHNPYNPLTRLVVSRCVFDENVTLLTRSRTARLLEGAGMKVVSRFDILFTPCDGPRARRLEAWLGALPLGAQYVVAAEVITANRPTT